MIDLQPGRVQLWCVPLDGYAPRVVEGLRGVLTDEERARADRFLRRRHGRRFVVARAGLRQLLGRALGVAPEAVVFEYGEHGKPSLDPRAHADDVTFNLSHSHELAVLGLTRGAVIGADVERRRRIERAMKIAERFFSAAEKAALRALPEDERHEAFLLCWTCKEAYIKAIGEGLSRPLRTFDVEFVGAPSLVRVEGHPAEPSTWQMRYADVGPDYLATVAVQGPISAVEVLEHRPGAP